MNDYFYCKIKKTNKASNDYFLKNYVILLFL